MKILLLMLGLVVGYAVLLLGFCWLIDVIDRNLREAKRKRKW